MSTKHLDAILSKYSGPVFDTNGKQVKLENIVKARDEKIDALRAYHATRVAAEEEHKKTYNYQRSLDDQGRPQWDTSLEAPGNTLGNLDAAINSSLHLLRGGIHSAPQNLEQFTNELNITEADREAFNQMARDGHPGNLTDDQYAQLNRIPSQDEGTVGGINQERFNQLGSASQLGVRAAEGLKEALFGNRQDQPSDAWSLMENAAQAAEEGQAIRDANDLTDTVDRTRQQAMDQQFTEAGWEEQFEALKQAAEKVQAGDIAEGFSMGLGPATEIAKMIGTVPPQNKMALLETLAESIPETVAMIFPPLRPLGYASGAIRGQSRYQEGLMNYREETNGEVYPPEDERQSMAAWAAAGPAGELLGDRIVGGMVHRGIQAVTGAGRRAAVDATEEIAEGLRRSLPGRAAAATGRIAQQAGKGFGAEFAGETFDTVAEGFATRNPVEASEAAKAGALGGWIGAGMVGTAGTVTEVAEGLSPVNRRLNEALKHRAKGDPELFKDAVERNDISAYMDRESKHYDPARAMDVLHAVANQEGTSEETKQQNLQAAGKLFDVLVSERDTLQAELQQRSPEYRARLEQSLAAHRSRLDSLPAEDTAGRTQTQAMIQAVEQMLAKGEITEEESKQTQKRIKELERQIQRADKTSNVMVQDRVREASPEAVERDIALASTQVSETSPEALQEAQEASERVIRLAMTAREKVDVETLTSLASDTGNALSEPQRAFLRAFSDARAKENALKTGLDVHEDILRGRPATKHSPEYLGIVQHQNRIGRAIAMGAQRTAQKYLAALEAFTNDRHAKLDAARNAYAMFQEDGQERSVQRIDDSWQIVDEPYASEAERARNGGLNINAKSGNVEDLFLDGVEALDAAVAEMQAAYELRFNQSTAVEPEANPVNTVQGVSETPVTQAESTEVQPTERSEVEVESTELTPPSPSSEETNRSTNTQEDPNRSRSPRPDLRDKMMVIHDDFRRGEGQATARRERGTFDEGLTVAYGDVFGYFFYKAPDGRDVSGSFRYDADTGVVSNLDIRSPFNESGASSIADLRKIARGLSEQLPKLTEIIAQRVTGARKGAAEFLRFTVDGGVLKLVDRSPIRKEEGDPRVPEAWNTPLEASPTQAVGEEPASTIENAEEVQVVQEESQDIAVESVPGVEPETDPLDESGYVAALSARANPEAHYQEQNILATHFEQQAKKGDDGTLRPLVAVKDFLSKVRDGVVNVFDFLPEKWQWLDQSEIDGNRAIDHFVEKASEWADTIDGLITVLPESKRHYRYEDLVQELIQTSEEGSPVFEENVKSAIALSAYTWTAETRGEPIRNTEATVNRILNRDTEIKPTIEEMQTYGRGVTQHMLIDSLGGRAMEALGFRVKKGSPSDLEGKMRSGLGVFALQTLLARGIIEEITVKAEDGKTTQKLFALKINPRDYQPEAGSEAYYIYEATKQTQNILQDLFGSSVSRRTPSFEPITEAQHTATNSRQGIAPRLKEIVSELNKVPYVMRDDVVHVMQGLNQETLHRIIGVVEVNEDTTHIDDRLGQEAANEALVREAESLLDFNEEVQARSQALEPGQRLPFYLRKVVWKNGRVGIDSVINPQGSKVHRYAISHPQWKSQVDTNDPAQLKSFMLRVAEGFGIATDKVLADSALVEVSQILQSDAVDAAIEALRSRIFEGAEITPEQQVSLEQAVARGGEKLKTLDALIAMANYRQAELEHTAEGGFTFETEIMAERDGVANGPILSHILLGAANSIEDLSRVLRMGGMYTEADGFTQFNQYKSAGNFDLYEHSANAIVAKIEGFIDADTANLFWDIGGVFQEVNEAQGITVTKAARDRVKALLNPLFFGSGLNKAVSAMADSFMENFKKQIVSAHQNGDDRHLKALQALNQIFEGQGRPGLKINEKLTASELMNVRITPAQQEAFKGYFMGTMGEGIKDAVKEAFGTFLERRDAINATARLAYTLYNASYEVMKQRYIAELVAKGEMAVGTNNQPIHDLSPEHYRELDNRVAALNPVMHTHYSRQDDALDGGIRLASTERQSSMDTLHSVQVAVNNTTMQARGFVHTQRDPGVLPISAGIHSFDSAASHDSQIERLQAEDGAPLLNMHDSTGGPLKHAATDTQSINQALFKNMLTYSPLQEVYNALDRTVDGLVKLLENEPDVAEAIKREVAQALVDTSFESAYRSHPKKYAKTAPELSQVSTFLERMMHKVKHMAGQADELKLDTLAEQHVIGQYAGEDGSYVLTDADRTAIAEQRKAIPRKVTQATQDNLQSLSTQLASQMQAAHKRLVGDYRNRVQRLQARLSRSPDLDVSSRTPANHGGPLEWNTYGEQEVALFPNSHLIQLLDLGLQTREEGDTVRGNLARVRDRLLTSNKSIQQVMSEGGLSIAEGRDVMQSLQNLFDAIPENALKDTYRKVYRGEQKAQSKLPPLVRFFESNPNRTVADTVKTLEQSLLRDKEMDANLRDFYRKTLSLVRRTLDPNVKVHYVTPATHPSIYPGLDPEPNQLAWYTENTETGEKTIFIKSRDFIHSAVTPEVVLHELVHSVVAGKVAEAQGNPDHELHEVVQDLQVLQREAREYAQSHNLDGKYAEALADTDTGLQEFIAWGMTSPGFQSEVMGQVQYQTQVGQGNRLMSAMRRFVENLSKLFFNRTKVAPSDTNGMSVLIANVSYVMASQPTSKEVAKQQIQLAATKPKVDGDALDYSTTQTLDALYQPGRHALDFTQHLRGVLGNVVQALHGPYGAFKERIKANTPTDPMDVYVEALVEGDTPFLEKATQAGITFSDQEGFVIEQVEQTVREALAHKAHHMMRSTRELRKLYNEARQALKGKIPEDKYNYLFAIEKTDNGRLDQLSRFVALGLADEEIHQAMQFRTSTADTRRPQSFAQTLQNWYYRMLQWMSERVASTYAGQQADEKLERLVQNLVKSEAKRQAAINRGKKASIIDRTDHWVAKQGGVLGNALNRYAKSSLVNNTENSFIRLSGKVAGAVAGDRVAQLTEGLQTVRDSHINRRNGLLMGLTQYVKGFPQQAEALLRQGTLIQAERKKISDGVARDVLESFAEQGEYLQDADKPAITNTFLRTGAHTLWERFGKEGLGELLDSPAKIGERIKEIEDEIRAKHPKVQGYLVKHTHALGAHLILGGSSIDGLMRNTKNIARMLTDVRNKDTLTPQEIDALVPELDVLASLYALKYVSPQDRQAAARIFAKESARSDGGHGIEATVKLHQAFIKDSQERLFQGQEVFLQQYFLPEIYHPRMDVQLATDENIDELTARGYEEIAELTKDAHDPDREGKRLVRLKDGGMPNRVSSTVAYTDQHVKGTEVALTLPAATRHQAQRILAAKQAQIRKSYVSDPGFDPSKTKNEHLVPVFDPEGNVVGWRYMMRSDTKDTMLERDNRFEHLLGRFAGTTYDKEATADHNAKVVAWMLDVYKADYSKRPDSFKEISPNSTDVEMRELWALFPEQMKKDIREQWGSDALFVPNELMDILFGFQEASVYNAFKKPEHERSRMQQAMVTASEVVFEMYGRARLMNEQQAKRYAKQAGIKLRRGELAWREVVQATKDNIVIKSINVLAMNIYSNLTLLATEGVPLKDGIQGQYIAYKGAFNYLKDSRELRRLEHMLAANYLGGDQQAELQRRVAELQDAIDTNPVKDLIDAGLLPTIVDDVSMDQDIYSYQSLLSEKLDPMVSKIPSPIRWLGRQVAMTHDTDFYRLLSQITQYGDFTARYVLRKHLMERALDPLSEQEANHRAAEAFVNYDIPLPRSMQYLDSMGLLLFFKYFFSIQRVLFRALREHPVRTGLMLMGDQMLGNLDDVMESSALGRFGRNPLQSGAFEYPSSFLDTGIIKGIRSVF